MVSDILTIRDVGADAIREILVLSFHFLPRVEYAAYSQNIRCKAPLRRSRKVPDFWPILTAWILKNREIG